MTDANDKPTFESRLEEIRWLLSPFESGVQCDCEQCTAARQLLAVVDAERMGFMPEQKARIARQKAEVHKDMPTVVERWRQRADAWDDIA